MCFGQGHSKPFFCLNNERTKVNESEGQQERRRKSEGEKEIWRREERREGWEMNWSWEWTCWIPNFCSMRVKCSNRELFFLFEPEGKKGVPCVTLGVCDSNFLFCFEKEQKWTTQRETDNSTEFCEGRKGKNTLLCCMKQCSGTWNVGLMMSKHAFEVLFGRNLCLWLSISLLSLSASRSFFPSFVFLGNAMATANWLKSAAGLFV